MLLFFTCLLMLGNSVLIEDLRFGAVEEHNNYYWGALDSQVTVNRQGHFFIVDLQEGRLLAFDATGKFLRIALNKGNGPHEVSALKYAHFLQDDRLFVLDGNLATIKIFDKNFKLEKQIKPSGMYLNYVSIAPNLSSFSGEYRQFVARRIQIKSGVFDAEGALLQSYSGKELQFPDLSNRDPAYWIQLLSESLKQAHQGRHHFTYDSHGELLYAQSRKYQIYQGWKNPKLVLSREDKPFRNSEAHINAWVSQLVGLYQGTPVRDIFTDSVVKKAVALSEPPPLKDHIFGIINMEDQGILVVRDLNYATTEQIADIFSKDYKFLRQIKMKHHPFVTADTYLRPRMLFKNGYAYSLETNEDGELQAVRYRLNLN